LGYRGFSGDFLKVSDANDNFYINTQNTLIFRLIILCFTSLFILLRLNYD
jgi:hypothetical protein